jgi:hypothetical protein
VLSLEKVEKRVMEILGVEKDVIYSDAPKNSTSINPSQCTVLHSVASLKDAIVCDTEIGF